ncbi:MAG: carbohydrate kinase family protein, partial [Patescibacteria group bacterium]
DIITFGSATRDIFVKPKNLTVLKYSGDFSADKGVCFPLGSKIELSDIRFSSGGGGTNTAATFAKQGFKTAFCGVIGEDVSGKDLLKELAQLGIETKLVLTTNKKVTNHSIIISGGTMDRTILAYRGASEQMLKEDVPWKKLKTKWLYLAPLSGLLCDIFGDIMAFAKKNGIKVAVNPGIQQLGLPKEKLGEILKMVDVLFLNQEEASFLTKIPYKDEVNIFKKIDEICPGVAVMTKGGNGVIVSDGNFLYSAVPPPNRVIIDTTGAGDSFASGFMSDFIRHSGDIEKAVQLGIANSSGCISKPGAKEGLLEKDQPFERVKVIKSTCDGEVCVVK